MNAKNLNISTGGIRIILLNEKDAISMNLKQSDRVSIKAGRNKTVAIIDITNDSSLIKQKEVGIFKETKDEIKSKNGQKVEIKIITKPNSIYYISKKLRGKRLTEKEMHEIIKDITNKKLTDVEMTYFVSACYMYELNMKEIVAFTKSMVDTGKKLNFNGRKVADKHCIGGVSGNRTTCIVIPIIAAAGYLIPKTSSRSITSPAGTADTMEILCEVNHSIKSMRQIVNKTNACLVWGGSMDVAPSDDTLIKVEHPMSLDPVGQMLASVLAKKKAAGATHCLIDIPVGPGAKIESKFKAFILKRKFEKVGKAIDIKVKAIITDGSEPVGNGIGPALEARDLLWTLNNDKRGSTKLLDKGTYLAGKLLKLLGEKDPYNVAKEIVESGLAAKKFNEILVAQGLKENSAEKIKIGKYKVNVISEKTGIVKAISNMEISRIARIAGAPSDTGAGVYLKKHHSGYVVK